MPCPFHPPWLDNCNYTWRRVKITKLLVRQILQTPVTSSLLSPNILLSTLFSSNLTLRSCLNVRDQISHSYRTTRNIVVLYTRVLSFFCVFRQETRRWKVLHWMIPLNLSHSLISLFFKVKSFLPHAQTPDQLIRCPRLLIQYIHSHSPYLKAVPYVCNLRTCHAVVTRDSADKRENRNDKMFPMLHTEVLYRSRSHLTTDGRSVGRSVSQSVSQSVRQSVNKSVSQ
jgi:hypothetical protein